MVRTNLVNFLLDLVGFLFTLLIYPWSKMCFHMKFDSWNCQSLFKGRIYSPIKYLWWSFSQKYWKVESSLIFFQKNFIIDIWQGPKYTSVLVTVISWNEGDFRLGNLFFGSCQLFFSKLKMSWHKLFTLAYWTSNSTE